MKFKNPVAIILATLWISSSEFIRNEFLLKDQWVNHYQQLGLDFPDSPVNGAVWGLWSFLFACTIFLISRKFNWLETVMLAWVIGFVLMWVVIWNLLVLPLSILPWAIPLSMLECVGATWIIFKIRNDQDPKLISN